MNESNLMRLADFSIVSALLVGCSTTQNSAYEHVTVKPSNVTLSQNIDPASCQHTKTVLHCVKVVEVHDGDTFFIDLPEAPPPFAERLPVRIALIDAPEITSKNFCEKRKAQKAKSELESLLYNAKRVDIVNVKRDLYFRIGGTVLADGLSVGEKLLKDKLAYSYYGQKKLVVDWCNY